MKIHAKKHSQPQGKSSHTALELRPQALKNHAPILSPTRDTENLPGETAIPALKSFAHDFSLIPLNTQQSVNPQQRLRENLHGLSPEPESDREELNRQEGQKRFSGIQKNSLFMSNPGDSNEQEAAEVAQKVVAGQSAVILAAGSPIARDEEGSAEITPEFQTRLEKSKGLGHRLDETVRRELGLKMCADFSDVNIHTGSYAHELSANIKARAFTYGKDIYFKQGNYNPASASGKELLAHELVHIEQQKNSVLGTIQRFAEGATTISPVVDVEPARETVQGTTGDFTGADEELQKQLQSKLKTQIDELKASSSPSVEFQVAYYTMMALATGANPFGLVMMPSVDSLWSLYAQGKLGYLTYLYNLGNEYITQKDEQGKEREVRNKDYKKGGYSKFLDQQIKNMLDPMFVVGEVKGIFEGIWAWFTDLWEAVAGLGSLISTTVTDSWNMLVHQKLPPWMNTIAEGAVSAAHLLKEQGGLILAAIGEMIRNPEELKKLGIDPKGIMKSGSAQLAYSAGESVAKKQVSLMGLSAEQQGEMLGKAQGYLLPEILIAVFSYTIANWIKGGLLALRGFWKAIQATKVMTKVFEAARWVVKAFEPLVQAIKGVKGGKFKKLGEALDKVMDYFKGLGKSEQKLQTNIIDESSEHKLGGSKESLTDELTEGTLTKPEKVKTSSFSEQTSDLAARIKAKLALYPKVIDMRTGKSIKFPSEVQVRVPKNLRVKWGSTQREAFKKQWLQKGYQEPVGGWKEYDIHHILPREFGGTNDFWNLVPVEKNTHKLFNKFWRQFIDL